MVPDQIGLCAIETEYVGLAVLEKEAFQNKENSEYADNIGCR